MQEDTKLNDDRLDEQQAEEQDAKLNDDRLDEQQEEQEFPEEPDWEEWEKLLLEDPKLAEQIKEELADYPELANYRELIRQNATRQRMSRYCSEHDWEAFDRELKTLPLKEQTEFDDLLVKRVKRELKLGAVKQVFDSTGRDEKGKEAFNTTMEYAQLDPQDGIEFVYAELILALKIMTMESVRRASTSDALPVRDVELNYAVKGALVVSTLTKALDQHREQKPEKPIRPRKKPG